LRNLELTILLLDYPGCPSYSHLMPGPFGTDHLKPRSYNILRSHTGFW